MTLFTIEKSIKGQSPVIRTIIFASYNFADLKYLCKTLFSEPRKISNPSSFTLYASSSLLFKSNVSPPILKKVPFVSLGLTYFS